MTSVATPGPAARLSHRLLLSTLVGLGLGASALLPACGGKKEVKQVEPVVIRDVPDVLRGTIGSEASINGTQPQLISGLGVVVGLAGTGGGDLDPAVAATMEREIARNGIGKGSNAEGALAGMSPQEFLRNPSVAVVIVEASIPPGAPKGANFDVSVRTLPGSSVTSLEGGVLWSTELRLGQATTFGGYKTHALATAKGPVYINPFAEPGTGDGAVTRTVGRVLNGGAVIEPLKLELVLDTDSHARARSIVAAINGRFPRQPGEPGQTARGRGSGGGTVDKDGNRSGSRQSVEISVPRQYVNDAATFLQLLRFTRVDPSYPEEFARRYVEELKNTPAMAEQLGWCLKAIGKPAVPFLVPLYDYPELLPRLTALEAGAFLEDARAVPHLIKLAQTSPPGMRTQAIRLLAKMPANPEINFALRDLVNSPELDVRAAAWEGLSQRSDPSVARAVVGPDRTRPKFTLETVQASGDPMVYITQQGEAKIVVFGQSVGKSGRPAAGLRLNKPAMVSAWSDRFTLVADNAESPARLRFVDRNKKVVTTNPPEDVGEFIRYLARRPSADDPGPGLDLSYSEVVGILYELSRQGGITATFATEQDRLRAEIYEAAQSTVLSDRPETSAAEDGKPATAETTVFQPRTPAPTRNIGDAATGTDWKPRIIPLTGPKKPAKGDRGGGTE